MDSAAADLPPLSGRASYWLHRVILNRSLNSLRSSRRRGRLELPATPGRPRGAGDPGAGENLFASASAGLAEQHRHILSLRDARGMNYPAIAAPAGIPDRTVKSALHRARVRIINQFRPQGFASFDLLLGKCSRFYDDQYFMTQDSTRLEQAFHCPTGPNPAADAWQTSLDVDPASIAR